MGVPSGEIIARPMVARACGCLQEFQHYAVDKYRAQRLAKFQKTRCATCVAKLNEEQRLAAAALPKKGEAFQQLPAGAQMTMTRRADGNWDGSLTASGKTVQAVADGPQGLSVSLARLWVSAQAPGAKPAAAKPAAPKPVPAPGTAPRPAPPSAAHRPAPPPKPGPKPS
jgi:hypothetical protein